MARLFRVVVPVSDIENAARFYAEVPDAGPLGAIVAAGTEFTGGHV